MASMDSNSLPAAHKTLTRNQQDICTELLSKTINTALQASIGIIE